MEEQTPSEFRVTRPSLVSSYVRMALPFVIGAALGLGIYFMASKNQAPGQATAATNALCLCPSCGMTIPKAPGLDCEEINCPNCGSTMNNAARLAAAAGTTGTMTQNRRETLAEQGVATPGPMTQNQRETLAEQRITTPLPITPAPLAAAFTPPLRDEYRCVCPNCGKTIHSQPGISCSNMRCPNCQSAMTNAIPVGGQRDMQLAAMGGGGNQGGGGAAAPCPGAGGGANQGGANQGNANQGNANQGGGVAPCPTPPATNTHQMRNTGGGAAPCPSVPQTTTQAVTYSNTVQGIIQRNCLRCHGGPMSRFLSSHESHQISAWIKSGAQP